MRIARGAGGAAAREVIACKARTLCALRRLAQGTTKLRPQDWKSGNNLWVVEVIAPSGGAEEMVKDLKEKVFPEREIIFLAVKDGKKEVRVVR